MRLVTYKTGTQAEFYVSNIGPNWGSVVDNVNRWHTELGKPTVASASFSDYPTIEVLDRVCTLFEAHGPQLGLLITIVIYGLFRLIGIELPSNVIGL